MRVRAGGSVTNVVFPHTHTYQSYIYICFAPGRRRKEGEEAERAWQASKAREREEAEAAAR